MGNFAIRRNKKKINQEFTTVVPLDDRIKGVLIKYGDINHWCDRDKKIVVQKSDQHRALVVQHFLEGKPYSLKPDEKGNAELSTDGHDLVLSGELTLARKTDLKLEGLKVILVNIRHYVYFGPIGGTKQSMVYANMRAYLPRMARLYGYLCVFVESQMDGSQPTTELYMRELAENVCAYKGNVKSSYLLSWYINQQEVLWGETPDGTTWQSACLQSIKRALTLVKAGVISHRASKYKSLQEIEAVGLSPWHVVNETVRYWVDCGCAYTKEDDAYVTTKKASKFIRMAYQATYGEKLVCQKWPLFMYIWTLHAPLEELPPYIRYPEGDYQEYTGVSNRKKTYNRVEDVIKARLQGSNINKE